MIKLSVIVPIYNVEKYLSECLQSIINQNIKDIEVIMVNDGSTDSSKFIAETFIEKDNRFILINQENKGLSAARNKGLSIAKGEYIFFIDSDDFIIDNNLEKMINIIEQDNSDVIAGRMVRVFEKGKIILDSNYFDLYNKNLCTNKEYLLISNQYNWAPVWLYIFRRELLISNNIKFKEGFLHEDEDFTPRVLLRAKDISIYNKEFYGYRQREGSITKTFSERNIKDIFKILIDLDEEYKNIDDDELKVLMRRRSIRIIKKLIYNNNYIKISKEMRRFILKSSKGKEKIDAVLIYLYPKLFFYKEVTKYKLGIE